MIDPLPESVVELLEEYASPKAVEVTRNAAALLVVSGYALVGVSLPFFAFGQVEPIVSTTAAFALGSAVLFFSTFWMLNFSVWVNPRDIEVSPPPFGFPRLVGELRRKAPF